MWVRARVPIPWVQVQVRAPSLRVRVRWRTRRVIVPNNDSRKMTCLNWLGAWLYYIRLKIFLYMHNRWILLFQMRYWRSFYSSVLVEKSAVYDNELPLSLLGVASLNTTLSYFLSLITTLQQNSSKNVFLQKKTVFVHFCSENKQRSRWHFCRACRALSKSKGS